MSNKQASFSSILSNNISELPNQINELPGKNMLDDVVLDVSNTSPLTKEQISSLLQNESALNEMTECPVTHKKGNISSCPFMNSQNRELKIRKFE